MAKVLFVPGVGDAPKRLIGNLAEDLEKINSSLTLIFPCERRLDSALATGNYDHLIISNDQTAHAMRSITSPRIFRQKFQGQIHNVLRLTEKGNAFEAVETTHYGADHAYNVNMNNLRSCIEYQRLLRNIAG